MKKTSSLFLAAALSCIAMSAAAGGSHGSQGSNGAAGGGGGGGGGGGSGIGVGIASARSTAAARATATNRTQVGVATNVGLGVTTGANTAAGGLGLGGNATGIGGAGGSIGSGAVEVTAGNSTYRAAASPSFAPPAHGPVKGCRLFVGLGGAGTSGSGSAGIPIGNDQACVTDTQHEFMDRQNARKPGTFTDDDYLRATCKFEGMSETQACKQLAGQQQTAAAPVGMAYTPN